jgi:hypothetical protein
MISISNRLRQSQNKRFSVMLLAQLFHILPMS